MARSKVTLISTILFLACITSTQAIGVSTAALITRNGDLSHPVSPLSLRDIDVSFGRYIAISSALSLYNINGMGITGSDGSPVNLGTSILGPFYTLLGSVGVKTAIPLGRFSINPMVGIFGFRLIRPTVRSGSLDLYIAEQSGHTTVDSSFTVGGRWGFGYTAGGSATFMVNDTIGIQAGALYYRGGSPLKLSGTYLADGSSAPISLPPYLESASIDFTGIELSIGVLYEL